MLPAGPHSWDAPPGDLLTIGDGVVMSPNATLDTTSLIFDDSDNIGATSALKTM